MLRLIARCVEELEGIFDIMNPLAQKDEAIIMPGFVEKVLGPFESGRVSIGLFKLVQCVLYVKNPLVRLVLGSGKEGFPLLQGFIESLSMAVHTGLTDGSLNISRSMKCSLTLLAPSMARNTVHIGRKHQAGRVRDANPSDPAVQLSWTKMYLLAVAFVTIGGGVSEGGNRSDLVTKKSMTA